MRSAFRTRQFKLLLGILLLPLLPGLGLAQPPLPSSDFPVIENLQLATVQGSTQCRGRYTAFLVSEAGQNGTDLNGDLDAGDFVAHIYDSQTGQVTNLGLAGATCLGDNHVALIVDESQQGNTDLNGNGLSDDVLFVHDLQTGITTNLLFPNPIGLWHEDRFVVTNHPTYPISVYDASTGTLTPLLRNGIVGTELGGGIIIIIILERVEEIDRNGDGDIFDEVLYLFDVETLTFTNTGYAASLALAMNDHVLFRVLENSQGETDLNGDGDTIDGVLYHYRVSTGEITNYQLAVNNVAGDGDLIACDVSEGFQGFTDLNGDSDRIDNVIHVIDLNTQVTRNLGLPIVFSRVSGDLVAFTVSEWFHGEVDLNGDGDAGSTVHADQVLHVYDHATDTTTNFQLAANRFPAVSDIYLLEASSGRRMMFFPVHERAQNQDYNGDSDLSDEVLHIHDFDTGITRNLLHSGRWLPDYGRLPAFRIRNPVFFGVDEIESRSLDYNGDRDTLDHQILHYLDVTTESVTNLGFQTHYEEGPWGILAVPVQESGQGVDLNQDGDLSDSVLHMFDFDRSRPCSDGTVDAGSGSVAEVLFVNGAADHASVAPGEPITLTLTTPPQGIGGGRYFVYAWAQPSAYRVPLRVGSIQLGCFVNPTPLHPDLAPQPIQCIRGSGLPGSVCSGLSTIAGPPIAPFSLTRGQGLSQPVRLLLQGCVEDEGADNLFSFSVTNAVTLDVE